VKAFVSLMGFALLVAVVAVGAAAVLIAATGYGLFVGGRALVRQRRRRAAAEAHRRAELAARCELENIWYLEGDPRGTYGRYMPVDLDRI